MIGVCAWRVTHGVSVAEAARTEGTRTELLGGGILRKQPKPTGQHIVRVYVSPPSCMCCEDEHGSYAALQSAGACGGNGGGGGGGGGRQQPCFLPLVASARQARHAASGQVWAVSGVHPTTEARRVIAGVEVAPGLALLLTLVEQRPGGQQEGREPHPDAHARAEVPCWV